jgi:hypothetical protein
MHAGLVTSPSRRHLSLVVALAAACLIPGAAAVASPAASCLPRPTADDRTAVLGGTTADDAEWVAAFGIDGRGIQLVCVDITLDGEEAASGVLGGPFLAGDDADEIVVSVLTTGLRAGPRWHVVRGTVTDDAARLEISIAGAEPIEAEIADVGPQTAWKWYAAVVPGGERGIPHVSATAYDGDGDVVAEGDSPF